MKPEKPSSIRVLLVDDSEAWRRAVRSMFVRHERLHVVAEAVDGLGAIQQAQGLQPDIILLDIGLPNLNGIEAAHQIGRGAPNAKIVFVTQNSDVDVVRAALSNGAHGYVLKADAGLELLPSIEAVLCGGKFVSRRLNA